MDSFISLPLWIGIAITFCPDGYPTQWRPIFCVQAIEEATDNYGSPEIFSTDQGRQFTSGTFISILKQNNIAISMDGRRRVQGNISIKRLWWTLKYNCAYLRSFANGSQLRTGLRNLFIFYNFYNRDRFHQSLDNQTPDEVYFDISQLFAKAA